VTKIYQENLDRKSLGGKQPRGRREVGGLLRGGGTQKKDQTNHNGGVVKSVPAGGRKTNPGKRDKTEGPYQGLRSC